MILSSRKNDDDSRDGFVKWPFMTTHTWGEYPQGTWKLEVRFNFRDCFLKMLIVILTQVLIDSPYENEYHGYITEWMLILHGTKDPPYDHLPVSDPHSKLAIVKKAHEERNKM